MRVALDVAELAHDARLRRIGEVEYPALPGCETICEQLPVGRHLVFGVMRTVPLAWHGQRRYQPPVAPLFLRDVEDGEEVRLCLVRSCGPEVEILLRRARGLSCPGCAGK